MYERLCTKIVNLLLAAVVNNVGDFTTSGNYTFSSPWLPKQSWLASLEECCREKTLPTVPAFR